MATIVTEEKSIVFGPYRINPDGPTLWRHGERVSLRPKAVRLLAYLAANPRRVISRSELLNEVWDGARVSAGVLKVQIHALRQALGDDASISRFVETVGRDGYRFLVGVSSEDNAGAKARGVFGREVAAAGLRQCMADVWSGARRLVFVSGEPGIGKTTIVEEFLRELPDDASVRFGRGQCVEQFGQGEAYLPMLAALGQLSFGPDRQAFLASLERYAPSWLSQLPALLGEAGKPDLSDLHAVKTPSRMLREMADALEALAAERPLVLLFEDMHWSDTATVELLGYLAERMEPARLMIIATYRPADIVQTNHPLRSVWRRLRSRDFCEEIELELLSEADVIEYVAHRFSSTRVAELLGSALHRHTDGNPLFVVSTLSSLEARGAIAEVAGRWEVVDPTVSLGVADNVRQLIARQIEDADSATQRLLDAAGVAGTTFTAAAVAGGLGAEVEDIDEACEKLADQGIFLEDAGATEWPDGTLTGRYRFRHSLYRRAVYDGVGEVRRWRLHRAIAERLESGFGSRLGEVADELAVHFDLGRDPLRAAQYHAEAGAVALRRAAFEAARSHLRRGLELIEGLPSSSDRDRAELRLAAALGQALVLPDGSTGDEIARYFRRAYELCLALDELGAALPTLQGLLLLHTLRGDLTEGRRLIAEFKEVANRHLGTQLNAIPKLYEALIDFYGGSFGVARRNFEEAIELENVSGYSGFGLHEIDGVGPMATAFLALDWWFLGFPDRARAVAREADGLIGEGVPTGSAVAMRTVLSDLDHRLGDMSRIRTRADELRKAVASGEVSQDARTLLILEGWIAEEQGDGSKALECLTSATRIVRTFGEVGHLLVALDATASLCLALGRTEDGMVAVAEAESFLERSDVVLLAPAIYSTHGSLLLQQARRSPGARRPPIEAQAEAMLQKAITVAQAQQAKSLELRATTALARWWAEQGKRQEAADRLRGIYDWFSEGHDTADLREAARLLGELEDE